MANASPLERAVNDQKNQEKDDLYGYEQVFHGAIPFDLQREQAAHDKTLDALVTYYKNPTVANGTKYLTAKATEDVENANKKKYFTFGQPLGAGDSAKVQAIVTKEITPKPAATPVASKAKNKKKTAPLPAPNPVDGTTVPVAQTLPKPIQQPSDAPAGTAAAGGTAGAGSGGVNSTFAWSMVGIGGGFVALALAFAATGRKKGK